MQRGGKGSKVGGPVMVYIIRPKHHPRELLQQIVFLVGGAGRADNADGLSTVTITNFAKLLPDQFKCFFPCGGEQSTVLLDERLSQAVFVLSEVECVTSLDTEE